MTIYALCESKENIYRILRDEAIKFSNQGDVKLWERKMKSAHDYKMSLPIEIASFELTVDCPFRD